MNFLQESSLVLQLSLSKTPGRFCTATKANVRLRQPKSVSAVCKTPARFRSATTANRYVRLLQSVSALKAKRPPADTLLSVDNSPNFRNGREKREKC